MAKSAVTMSELGVIRDAAIVVEEGEVIEVGRQSQLKSKYPRYEKVDASNCVVIPGLINAHTHMAMSLLRGYADDLMLHEWLEKWIWPLESKMSSRDIYVGALLASVEAVKMGTTTVNTMYHYNPDYNEAKAILEVGLRGVVSHVCFSWRKEEDFKQLNHLTKHWHGKGNWKIRAAISPHAPYTVDPKYMVELREYADELNKDAQKDYEKIIVHIHLAETKNEAELVKQKFKVNVSEGVVKYLYDLKVLKEDVVAAHCTWLTDKDIQALKKAKVKAVHNPASNLKLASGISPVHKLLSEGITVALGTDSACSSNSLDMFEAVKLAALLHKGATLNPTVVPAETALKMATVNGAKALSWSSQIGTIKPGVKADLVIIDFNKPHLKPLFNELSHLVYAVKSLDVRDVMVNGEFIVENGKVKTVDENWVMKEAEKVKESLLERLRGEAREV